MRADLPLIFTILHDTETTASRSSSWSQEAGKPLESVDITQIHVGDDILSLQRAVYRAIIPRPHLDKSESEESLCACNHLEFVYLCTGANMNVAIHAPSTIKNSAYHSPDVDARVACFFFCFPLRNPNPIRNRYRQCQSLMFIRLRKIFTHR